jgi:hypothetical protein
MRLSAEGSFACAPELSDMCVMQVCMPVDLYVIVPFD